MTVQDVIALIQKFNLAPDAKEIAVDEEFESMGIDSLNRATLYLEVEEAFGKKLPPEDEERYGTVNQLVAFVKE